MRSSSQGPPRPTLAVLFSAGSFAGAVGAVAGAGAGAVTPGSLSSCQSERDDHSYQLQGRREGLGRGRVKRCEHLPLP